MHIETDKYLITSDNHNIIVQVKGVTADSSMLKDKSKIGSISLGDKCFYPNLEKAFNGIANKLILGSEAQDFEDIKMLMRELIEEVKHLEK